MTAFAAAHALSERSDDPAGASRPFDRGRDGFVRGEGAAGVVLDSPDPTALARFYSELLGMPVTREDGDWVDLGEPPGMRLSFQLAPDQQPPRRSEPASSMR